MMLKSLKHAAWPALVACAAVAACSKMPATEDAFAIVTVGPGADPSLCSEVSSTASFFSIGNTTSGDLPETVPSGDMGLTVTCSVTPANGGYDIEANATLAGGEGGSFTVQGHVNAGVMNTGITGRFYSAQGRFQATDCTITFTYNRGAIPESQQLAPGEIFGHISCPDAQDQSGEQVATADGGTSVQTCDAEADFLFQQCNQ